MWKNRLLTQFVFLSHLPFCQNYMVLPSGWSQYLWISWDCVLCYSNSSKVKAYAPRKDVNANVNIWHKHVSPVYKPQSDIDLISEFPLILLTSALSVVRTVEISFQTSAIVVLSRSEPSQKGSAFSWCFTPQRPSCHAQNAARTYVAQNAKKREIDIAHLKTPVFVFLDQVLSP